VANDPGRVSGNKYHSFKTEKAKSCRLLRLHVDDVGGEVGGVELVGGTMTVPPPELLPPPPQAVRPAAKMTMTFFNAPFFMPLYLSLNSVYAAIGAPEGGHRQVRFRIMTQLHVKFL
jgi:hypothetical protein